jgi:hypothetical protein
MSVEAEDIRVEEPASSAVKSSAPPFASEQKIFTPVDTDKFLEEEIAKSAAETKEAPKFKPAAPSAEQPSAAAGNEKDTPASPGFHKQTAGVLVSFYNMGLGYLGMFISGTDDPDAFKMKKSDESTLTSLTADYLATVKMDKKLPAWLPLAGFALIITLGTIFRARKIRAEKESAPKQPAPVAAPANERAPEPANVAGPIPFSIHRTPAGAPAPSSPAELNQSIAPHWKKGNPVADNERTRRMKAGNPVCDTCNINHVRTPDSKRCSKECSGEATKRMRNG